MNGTLMCHRGAQEVTREELLTLPAPVGTSTWKPIAHADLIQAIDRQLMVRGITIQSEQFALQREGSRFFAVLDLSIENTEEFCAAMGVRTSNDQSMALEIAVGVKVFVCDNLVFSGDLIALRRKHTLGFDLNADVSRAVDRYQKHLLTLCEQIEILQEKPVTDQEARVLIFEAFYQEILPIRYFSHVAYSYLAPKPEMADVMPRTWWGLHNAFTRAIKDMAPASAFAATTALGKFFGLKTMEG